MTINEAIAKYNFITKVLLKNGNDELSKELKVKIMSMRIELSKIKRTFDEDSKEFANQLVTDEFRELIQKENKTPEEEEKAKEMEAKLNSEYNLYLIQLGNKEVEGEFSLTQDEYNEVMLVNIDNDVNINGQQIDAANFLEIINTLFCK